MRPCTFGIDGKVRGVDMVTTRRVVYVSRCLAITTHLSPTCRTLFCETDAARIAQHATELRQCWRSHHGISAWPCHSALAAPSQTITQAEDSETLAANTGASASSGSQTIQTRFHPSGRAFPHRILNALVAAWELHIPALSGPLQRGQAGE